MKRVRAGIVGGIFLMLCACQTSEKQRRSERLKAMPRADEQTPEPQISGPTIYGEPVRKVDVAPCKEGDAGLDRKPRPHVDVGVEADVQGKNVQNPHPYAEANCDP